MAQKEDSEAVIAIKEEDFENISNFFEAQEYEEQESLEESDEERYEIISLDNPGTPTVTGQTFSQSYGCWICLQRFPHCLDVKKHILENHLDQGLCALVQREIDNTVVQTQLLLFCPKDCEYATSSPDAYSAHVADCENPRMETTLLQKDYLQIQNEFILQEYYLLQDKFPPEASIDTIEEGFKFLPETGSNTGRQSDDVGISATVKCEVHHSSTESVSASKIEIKEQPMGCEDLDVKDIKKIHDGTHFCYDCSLSFSNRLGFLNHLQEQHKDDQNSPRIMTIHSLNSNKKTVPPEEKKMARSKTSSKHMKFKCGECGKCFSRNSHLDRHVKIHTGEKPFECGECGLSFIQASSLTIHMRIHTGEKPFKCDECGKTFIRSSHLHLHQRTHTDERPFECSECGRAFRQTSQLQIHMRTHTKERPFHCTLCGKTFARSSHLTLHIRTHTGEKTHRCHDCGKGFTQSSQLYAHLRSSRGVKPFSCDECGKRFSQKGHLGTHMRIHTGEKPFKCSECGKSFSQSSQLVTHMRIHTGERPFQCKECGKSFNQKGILRGHMVIHTRKNEKKKMRG